MNLEIFILIFDIIIEFLPTIGFLIALIFLLNHLRSDPFIILIDLDDEKDTTYKRDYIICIITNATDYVLNIVITLKLIINNEILKGHDRTYKIILNPRGKHTYEYNQISDINKGKDNEGKDYELNSTSYSNNAQPLKIRAEAHFTNKWYNVWKLKKSIKSEWAYDPNPPKLFIRLK